MSVINLWRLETPIEKKETFVLVVIFTVESAVLLPLRLFSLKTFSAGAFTILSRKQIRRETMCCFRIGYLLWVRKILSHTHKRDLGTA